MTTWASEELQSVELGDQRLNNRLKILVETLARGPEGSIPQACHGDPAGLKAAYRVFAKARVEASKILAGHVASTCTRGEGHATSLARPESRPESPPKLPTPPLCNIVDQNDNRQGPGDKRKLVPDSSVCLGTTIWFNKDEESIAERSLKTNFMLQKVIATLKKYPNTKVQIEGHTDQIGSEKTNELLSKKRADKIASFFKREGIAPHRITSLGYGASCLVDNQNTTNAQAKNRRVELRIIQDD